MNLIQTKPLCASSSNLAGMLTMVNPIDFGGHSSKVKVTIVINDKCGVRGDATLCVVIFEFPSAISEKKSKMSQPIRGQGGYLVFPIGPKNTNLVEGVEILLPVKFC